MVGIIDYKIGNVKSVGNALQRVGAEYIITSDPEILQRCGRIILPGVGSAGWAMQNIREGGLDRAILSFTQPVLGICLGMQILCSYSEEDSTECLGVFSNRICRFPKDAKMSGMEDGERCIKIPHIGWNTIFDLKSPLYNSVPENSYVYFVHSYYADVNENTAATANYGIEFSASLKKGNFMGCQFHPEKSGDAGERILLNFLSNEIINL